MPSLLIRNATIVTMNDRFEIVDGAVGIRDGRIVSVGPEPAGDPPRWDATVNAGGGYLLPGFIQTHVHLCQTLFRSFADDLPLLEELERRYLLHVLKVVGGHRTRAAEVMGIDRRTLYRMAERFGVKDELAEKGETEG